MSILKTWLLQRARRRLQAAAPLLHLVPGLDVAYRAATGQIHLQDAPVKAAVKDVLRTWWRAHCIERCAHHAAQAGQCEEVGRAARARRGD